MEIFCALCLKLKTLIYDAKEKCYKKQISDCGGDQKQLLGIVNSFLGGRRQIVYPQHTDSFTLASLFNNYFNNKIADIRNAFIVLESDAAQPSVTDFSAHSNVSHTSLTDFTPTNIEEVQKLLSKMNKTTCKLNPFCTSIIMQYPQYFVHVYVYIINLCFSSGVYPTAFKSAIVKPLIKKPTLDCKVLKIIAQSQTYPFYQNSLKR